MKFADLHMHLLFDVDDGAADEEQMKEILEEAYADGTRVICATPHFHPGYFGNNTADSRMAFERLKSHAKDFDGLEIYFGNELRFSSSASEWLSSGMCRSINGTEYVLIDFLENDDSEYIVSSTLSLLNAGYVPILAHAERYAEFHKDMREIIQLKQSGAKIQVDSQSPFGNWGAGAKQRSRRLLKNCLADIVASDAHNISSRPPIMSNCYAYTVKKCGEEYAKKIFWDNPISILYGKD